MIFQRHADTLRGGGLFFVARIDIHEIFNHNFLRLSGRALKHPMNISIRRENGGAHGNNAYKNAYESHKLITLYVLWLLIKLKTALNNAK